MDLKQYFRMAGLAAVAAVLILDSRCAAESAAQSVELCLRTLIPGLFPLFVISAVLVPELGRTNVPGLSRLLGIPVGSEGIFLLGTVGGFPVGAACICQAVRSGGITKSDGERMLGFCSSCGPSFLFGILASILRPGEAAIIFLIQLETAVCVAALWPGGASGAYQIGGSSVSLPEAVRKALNSMGAVCAWVILAGVLTGLLKKWFFPYLPDTAGILLTGLLEITGGSVSLHALEDPDLRFLLAAIFVCFGGVSVLLQIQALARDASLSMRTCIRQKCVQAILAGVTALVYLKFGWIGLILPVLPVFGKIAVEISRPVVYNSPEKGGI